MFWKKNDELVKENIALRTELDSWKETCEVLEEQYDALKLEKDKVDVQLVMERKLREVLRREVNAATREKDAAMKIQRLAEKELESSNEVIDKLQVINCRVVQENNQLKVRLKAIEKVKGIGMTPGDLLNALREATDQYLAYSRKDRPDEIKVAYWKAKKELLEELLKCQ